MEFYICLQNVSRGFLRGLPSVVTDFQLLRLCYMLLVWVQKNPIQDFSIVGLMKGGVVPPGIEPGTHGFSVRCSTN